MLQLQITFTTPANTEATIAIQCDKMVDLAYASEVARLVVRLCRGMTPQDGSTPFKATITEVE